MRYEGKVYILLKDEVLDPQGQVVCNALKTLGFQGVKGVRVGKYIRLHLEAPDRSLAEKRLDEMCRKLLANPVIERYSYELHPFSFHSPSVPGSKKVAGKMARRAREGRRKNPW